MYQGFQKGMVPSFKKGHLTRQRQCFRDTSKHVKGQGELLGIFLDKTSVVLFRERGMDA
jgi:hypothetical protein